MVKSVDPIKLNTSELRDFLAEAEIVENKIKAARSILGAISTPPWFKKSSGRKTHFFIAEGQAGVIVKDLNELKDSLKSLRKRVKPVQKTLLNSLTDFGKG